MNVIKKKVSLLTQILFWIKNVYYSQKKHENGKFNK